MSHSLVIVMSVSRLHVNINFSFKDSIYETMFLGYPLSANGLSCAHGLAVSGT